MAKLGIFVNVIANLKFEQKLNSIKRKVNRKEFMLQIGEQIKTLIQGDTRTGKGVADSGNGEGIRINLATLSPKYVAWKNKYKGKSFTPGRFFRSGNKSNLTLTGQMIDAIDVEAKESYVRVFVKDSPRSGYGKDHTNKEIADFVARNGRPFMGLSQQNKLIIDREIERETRAIVRRELARK